jgi:hypothetical protein
VDDAPQVDVDESLPLGDRGVEERPCHADPGVVDHDVRDAVFFAQQGGELLHRAAIGDVEQVRTRGGPQRAGQLRGALNRLLVDVGGHHLRALLGELQGGGPTDAAARAGDHHEGVVEPLSLSPGTAGAAQTTGFRSTLGVIDQLTRAARHGARVGAW